MIYNVQLFVNELDFQNLNSSIILGEKSEIQKPKKKKARKKESWRF